MKNLIYQFITYFITSSFLMWLSYKILFFNEFISNVKLLYWLLPTITAVIVSLILLLCYRKHKGYINHIIVFLLCLSSSNLFGTPVNYCDPRRNAPFFIIMMLFIINSILVYLLIKNLKKRTLSLNKWIIYLITGIIIYGNYFYIYSINMLYDYLFL